ncbi:phosphodiesterase [Chelatococcus reniformis]|nr:phosphodiesterase [Chelatococcus reniformis]
MTTTSNGVASMLIVQLSDLHLCDEGALYNGVVSTNDMARRAVAQVNALAPAPDLVLLTGDVTEHGTPSQYAVAHRILGELRAPLYVMPGNHDDRDALRTAFAAHRYMPAEGPINFAVEGTPVRIVAIDVTVPGAHHGHADDATLAWLSATLAKAPVAPTIIAMHQPPFACGIPYLDPYRCMNPDALAAVIQRHGHIERVVCGHVHRSMQRRWAGTLALTAPSTATQIALDLGAGAKPASYLEPPGYLLHRWSAETGLMTHLVPIGEFAGPFPFA